MDFLIKIWCLDLHFFKCRKYSIKKNSKYFLTSLDAGNIQLEK
jgi:hypothetical protein